MAVWTLTFIIIFGSNPSTGRIQVIEVKNIPNERECIEHMRNVTENIRGHGMIRHPVCRQDSIRF